MNILCWFDGHNFQIVDGSEYRSVVTKYFGKHVTDGPHETVGFVKRCKRCGYEHGGYLRIPVKHETSSGAA